MNPSQIPAIDVREAERRLREDADRPLLLDVREMNEFLDVRAPGAALRGEAYALLNHREDRSMRTLRAFLTRLPELTFASSR